MSRDLFECSPPPPVFDDADDVVLLLGWVLPTVECSAIAAFFLFFGIVTAFGGNRGSRRKKEGVWSARMHSRWMDGSSDEDTNVLGDTFIFILLAHLRARHVYFFFL
uniref:(northern house mosquito) hypothetical protein n=1 Tax=Culex pipiens TaxID=7175 RepID=A0A8D8I9R3_CULPI